MLNELAELIGAPGEVDGCGVERSEDAVSQRAIVAGVLAHSSLQEARSNVTDHRRRAGDNRKRTEAPSRRSVDLYCWPF